MEWIVSLNCIVLKNILSQEFHYIKCQAFNPSSSSNNAILSQERRMKQWWWNEDFSSKYNYWAFCNVLWKAIRNYSWKLARRETNLVFNVWVFYCDFFIAKKLFLPFAKQRLLYRCQSGLEFFWWGLKMSTVIPEKWLWLQEVTWLMLKLAASFFWR